MSIVDCGRWKLETAASGTEYWYGGKMNLLVQPSNTFTSCVVVT